MKTKITLIGFVLLLGAGTLAAQICPPRISFSWGNDRYRNNDRDYRYNDRNRYRYDRDNRRSRNRDRDKRYQGAFVIYSLDIYDVRNSFGNTLDDGFRFGNLTNREVRKLNDRFDKVEREFKCALEDGYISRKDERRIFDKINDLNNRIRKEWYDNDYR